MSDVRIIALGGVGEIGKNCTVVEQDDDIIVVDCGLSFPNEEMPGIDIVLPDFTYLVENRDRVRGVFLTHAHEDHVGALGFFLEQLNVPVFASEFTLTLIRPKLEERHAPKNLDLRPFAFGDQVAIGSFLVEPVRITHSIPENAAFAIHTKHGVVFFTGDFKFDFTPVDGKLTNMARIAEIGKEGVVALLSDTTNIERPGWGPSESTVSQGLRKVFLESEGRVLLTTFASNIHRMQQVYEVAAETGRKVAVVGRRMEQNVDVCSRMGYLRIPDGVRISLEDARKYAPNQLAILTTGSQGEPLSALVQMSKGEYGRFQINEGDTLIYSARPIPGNEAAIWRTINRIFRMGARVVYDAETPIHVSGHAYREELKMMINLLRPFYLAPVHGEPRHQFMYLEMARGMGYPEHRLFTLDAGIPLEIGEKSAQLGEQVACGRVLVDNSGTPGVSDTILRDRHNLSRDGFVAVTVAVDPERGEIVGEPMIQARGFHGPEGFVEKLQGELLDFLLHEQKVDLRDSDKLRHDVSDFIRRIVAKRTQLRPLVLPVVVEV